MAHDLLSLKQLGRYLSYDWRERFVPKSKAAHERRTIVDMMVWPRLWAFQKEPARNVSKKAWAKARIAASGHAAAQPRRQWGVRRESVGIDKEWEMVKEFHEKFGHPAKESPEFLGKDRAEKRRAWMLEELGEFMESETLTDQADAMIDLIYFALGTMVEMGVRPERLFSIVHKANMDKLWADGKPRWRKD
jgi:hypothetical protein